MSKVKKTAETPLVNTDGNEKNQLSGSSAQKEAGGKTARKKVVKDGVTAEMQKETKPVKSSVAMPVKAQVINAAAISPANKTPESATAKKGAAKKINSVNAPAAASPEKTVEEPAKKALPKKAVKKVAEKIIHELVVADKKAIKKTTLAASKTKLTFLLRFHTKMGQSLFVTGDHEIFGNNDLKQSLPLHYLSDELWTGNIDLNVTEIPEYGITYNYLLKDTDGSVIYDWGSDKVLKASQLSSEEILIVDSWNFAGYFENAFYTEPFKHVLLKNNASSFTTPVPKKYTHTFKVKAPLLTKDQTLCMIGSCNELGNWSESNPVLMSRVAGEDFFSAHINLAAAAFPIIYKYGVYDLTENKFMRYEGGSDHILYDAFVKTKKTIVNDGFAVLPTTTWKGAGVAIPVFSLRSMHSGGCGEFSDLRLLVDWAKQTGLKLIQILPVNDTTATHSWTDCYPYAAISAFALHPMYINLWQAADASNKHLVESAGGEFNSLNKKDAVDYEAVNNLKWDIIKQLYPLQKDALFASETYKEFTVQNKHWLIPYAAFCYFRDKYNTADFNQWPVHKQYDASLVEELLNTGSAVFDHIAIHFFVQYYLHMQLKDATSYAHDNGIVVKGDIPIGIYRYGSDAWQQPELYHMNVQAGAPPDDFAVTGQNWGFPTYNWEKMRENGFAWWKQRFEQMSYYFDAFRIDHILGFFRIWSIPIHSVEGIMGHFEPATAIHINEFHERNIWFDYNRYCRPFITESLLDDTFGDQKHHVIHTFLNYDGFGKYQMRPEYATQQQVESYFSWQEDNEHNSWLKKHLFSLISNVILFEVEGSGGQQFHFRFGIEGTTSFQNLEGGTQQQLKALYVDYFFRRQDNFWSYEAMQKLPALKRSTNMLVCGEDLGLVPGCVPEVMHQLGILSLEIQRMPKDPNRTFFHPADAPYMSVVTPSTHDMSTIRGWWEEDRKRTQQFYNNDLGQWGEPPYFCDDWVNKAIVVQHLYSPAMWSIFQLQDILGSDVKIRRPNPHEERINVPANPKHYWNYRMHLMLEDLNKADAFNTEFGSMLRQSGRS